MRKIYYFLRKNYLFFASLALFFIIRTPFFLNIFFEFNADEAVNGLMALHILEGKVFPIFMYGQSYMGAIEPWLASLFFSIFGPSIFLLRITPLIGSLIMLIFVYLLGNHFFRQTKYKVFLMLSAVLLPPYLLAYSLSVVGGRFHSIALGAILYFIYFKYYLKGFNKRTLFLMAVVAGFGFYIDKLYLHFILPLLAVFFLKDLAFYVENSRKTLRYYMVTTFLLASVAFLLSFVVPLFVTSKDPIMLFGFIRFSSSRSALNLWLQLSILCFLPYTVYFVKLNFKSLTQKVPLALAGFILGYIPNIVYKLTSSSEVYGHANFYLTKNITFALQSLWSVNFEKASFFTLSDPTKLAFYITCILIVLALSTVSFKKLKLKEIYRSPAVIYTLSVLAGIFAFLLSAMTDTSSFRYLGSFMVVVPFIVTIIYKSLYERKKGLAYLFSALYIFLAIFQIGSYYGEKKLFTSKPIQHHLMDNSIPAFHELISELEKKGLKYSFSDYWVSYIITFLSKEKHISTPTKDKWIRVQRYLDDVTKAGKKAYIYRLKRPESIKQQDGYIKVDEFQTSEFKVVVVEKKL